FFVGRRTKVTSHEMKLIGRIQERSSIWNLTIERRLLFPEQLRRKSAHEWHRDRCCEIRQLYTLGCDGAPCHYSNDFAACADDRTAAIACGDGGVDLYEVRSDPADSARAEGGRVVFCRLSVQIF